MLRVGDHLAELSVGSLMARSDAERIARQSVLRQGEADFASFWDCFQASPHVADHKTIVHSVVGTITVDCDVLSITDVGLRMIIFTVAPESPDAASLDLVRVVGLQELTHDA